MDQRNSSKSLPPTARTILGILVITLALLVLIGGWVIPFQFESSSILYKFGIEKTLLRSGKLTGITVLTLVFFQIVLASRFAIPERIFSRKFIMKLHRAGGMVLGIFVLAHPLLIKASEDFTPYTFAKKYYPEFVGFALLAVLLVIVGTAIFRNPLRLSYPVWLLLHRILATVIIFIIPAHVLFVSETFKSGPPRIFALILLFLNLLMLARIWWRRIVS